MRPTEPTEGMRPTEPTSRYLLAIARFLDKMGCEMCPSALKDICDGEKEGACIVLAELCRKEAE